MLPGSEHLAPSIPEARPPSKIRLRLAAGVLLLAGAIVFTWMTIDGLSSRRRLRTELAEISHARYGVLNADRWVEKLVPILAARIDTLDLTATDRASLRPAVENVLYRLLDDIKEKMSEQNSRSPGPGGLLVQGNALIANMLMGALRPHVPEYAQVVLAELGKPETKESVKQYIKTALAASATETFGRVDMQWYSAILKRHGCPDAGACQAELGHRIREADTTTASYYLAVLVSSLAAFIVLMTDRPVLRRSDIVILVLFCVVLLAGGVFTPMIEVEAKISTLSLTFLGEPIVFPDQVLYFQSKSVLEVFQTLITQGRPDMWIVGVLVLMFSVVFPSLKILTSAVCLYDPALLRENRVARFFMLESSKWSMADVMALAIFMAFVAFNGLIANTMDRLQETGAQLVIPTDSSKLLPGYYLFLGFCIASLCLSRKLRRGIGDFAEPRNRPQAPSSQRISSPIAGGLP